MEGKKHHTNWEQQWLEGKISSDEAKKYASDDDQFELFRALIDGSKQLDVPRVISKETAWSAIENKISTSSPKVISISRRNWFIGVAASFILTLGAFFLFQQNDPSSISTKIAQTGNLTLPDQSMVYLNIDSEVAFNEDKWEIERIVNLKGEAFFEVEKGSRFLVITPLGNVEVLGTSFNVRARANSLLVTCKTGKVKVSTPNGDAYTIINPGEKVSISEGELSDVLKIDVERIAIWRSNEFDYESLPLREVFDEIERVYNVSVKHSFSEDELNATTSGTFRTDDLRDAIKTLEISKGLKSEILEDGKVIVFEDK